MSHIQRNATEVIDLTVHVYKLLKQIRVIIHTIKVNTWDQEGKQGKTPGKGKGEGWKKDVGDLFPDPGRVSSDFRQDASSSSIHQIHCINCKASAD